MSVLSPLPDDQITKAPDHTSRRHKAGSTAGRSPTASTPAQNRKMFHCLQLRTKNTVKNVYCAPLKAQNKTTAKNDILTALKAQKKPAPKKHVLKHIKKRKKPVFTADPRAP